MGVLVAITLDKWPACGDGASARSVVVVLSVGCWTCRPVIVGGPTRQEGKSFSIHLLNTKILTYLFLLYLSYLSLGCWMCRCVGVDLSRWNMLGVCMISVDRFGTPFWNENNLLETVYIAVVAPSPLVHNSEYSELLVPRRPRRLPPPPASPPASTPPTM